MDDMAILITGNLGFLGARLVEHLSREACASGPLIGLDSGLFSHCEVSPIPAPSVQLMCDVRNPPAPVGRVLESCREVVHLAAVTSVSPDPAAIRTISDTNFAATLELARVAKFAGVRRFMYASVLGSGSASSDPSSADSNRVFARSKHQAELALEALADENFQVTCLRFAQACGSSPVLRLDTVFNEYVASALFEGRIVVERDQVISCIHIDDMIRAIDWARTRPLDQLHCLRLDIGSDDWSMALSDWARCIADTSGNVPVEVTGVAHGGSCAPAGDFSAFRGLAPAFQPRARIDAAVIELRKQLRVLDFEGTQFRRSRWIRSIELQAMLRVGLVDEGMRWRGDGRPCPPRALARDRGQPRAA